MCPQWTPPACSEPPRLSRPVELRGFADALMVQRLRQHLDRHARATFKRLMSDHQRERQRLRAQINQKARRQYVNDLALEDY
jgi:hypothetical protein